MSITDVLIWNLFKGNGKRAFAYRAICYESKDTKDKTQWIGTFRANFK